MQAHREFRVFRGFVEKWDRKVIPDVKALKETWVLRVLPVRWVLLALSALREMPALRVPEESPVLPDPPAQ